MVREIKTLHIDHLHVNPHNYRHDDVADEATAIATLLDTLPSKMKHLAKDIAETGELFMLPLVGVKDDGVHVVFDGNRRLTCLKLLHKPHHAPTGEWQEFFVKTANNSIAKLPLEIDCQIVSDPDWIDNYLYRIHTGAQDGIGQINWDNPSKARFVERTGKTTKINLPGIIEDKLRAENLIEVSLKFKYTNLERLLSSEEFRSRVGISVKNREVIFIRDVGKSLAALVRIVEDLASGTLNLNHLLVNDNKRKYLNALEKEGALPTAHDDLDAPIDFKTGKVIPAPKDEDDPDDKPPSTPPPKVQKTLIRAEDGVDLKSQAHTKRAMDIWAELQHHLEFGKHDNAIAVLFRVLLELSVENYIKRWKVPLHHNKDQTLVRRFKKIAAHMHSNGLIDESYMKILTKLEGKTMLLSIDTLHQYVHSKHLFPSSGDLKSKWDTLTEFVVICLKA
jgi:hypothetical protein